MGITNFVTQVHVVFKIAVLFVYIDGFRFKIDVDSNFYIDGTFI